MDKMVKPNTDKLTPNSRSELPSMEMPNFRFLLAQERRLTGNVLIRTPYALGDCVCAEPAIRYATKFFDKCKISVATPFPDLYRHLPLKDVLLAKDHAPDWKDLEKYYVIECYHAAESLQSQFVHNFNMPIEDYISVCLFKGLMPVEHRNIVLKPMQIERMPPQQVVIHAGKHWISKTFPKKYWDAIIHGLLAAGVKPTLIGAKLEDDKRGYVEVDATHCFDWRDKLTVMQSASALQDAAVVLTNDSAPYHMAASGNAEIGVFSTVRHFDFIGHWRPLQVVDSGTNYWNHKITNLAKGQMWKDTDTSPLALGRKYDVIDYSTLMSWLPEPESVVKWTLEKLNKTH